MVKNRGEVLKDAGISLVASNNLQWLQVVRLWAKGFYEYQGFVTADDVRFMCELYNFWPQHRNAFGAIFRSREWRQIGIKRSMHAPNHAREIRIWAYDPQEHENNG